MVYGQANTGVSNSCLLAQRRAVAAASVSGGSGDLDLTLILADGSLQGHADPAFAAHEEPIGLWSEAVWNSWLPRSALNRLARHAIERISAAASPWAMVAGPAAAFVASASRLGWVLESALKMMTDRGAQIDLCRDPPAYVRDEVRASVWRWRWRNVEAKIPAVRNGLGGDGALFCPIFQLLRAKHSSQWGSKEKAGLRSVIANRQWTQTRLHSAGMVLSRNCRPCVQLGYCTEADDNPAYWGTLLYRAWTCPATEDFRSRMVPQWLRAAVRRSLFPNGKMAPADLALYTRALAASPAASLQAVPTQETFQ